MKIVIIILIVLMAVFGVWIFSLFQKKETLETKLIDFLKKVNKLKEENNQLEEKIKYLSVPDNLEKELREKFDYKKPEEKTIIVIP